MSTPTPENHATIHRLHPSPAFTLSTDAIGEGGLIDPRYTCDVDNSSPELRWENPPEGTGSFALLTEDLDVASGLFAHWLVYNIPASIRHLPAGIPAQDTLPNGIRQGVNSLGKLGYAGPCPPLGSPAHRYVFRLFALSSAPELASRSGRDAFMAAIEPLVLAKAEVTGLYRRMGQKAG